MATIDTERLVGALAAYWRVREVGEQLFVAHRTRTTHDSRRSRSVGLELTLRGFLGWARDHANSRHRRLCNVDQNPWSDLTCGIGALKPQVNAFQPSPDKGHT